MTLLDRLEGVAHEITRVAAGLRSGLESDELDPLHSMLCPPLSVR